VRLLVVSDLHLAGPRERMRRAHEAKAIGNPLLRLVARAWRQGFWLKDPLAHNDKLDRIVALNPDPEVVVANGDYTVNSAFVGISDDASCESAGQCLDTLRSAYGSRLLACVGDHELGKHSLFGGQGGPRFESWRRVVSRLRIEPWWRRDFGKFAFIAVPSTLMALPAFEPELLAEERPLWHAERERVVREVAAAIAAVGPDRRIVLFCHDPTALPHLLAIPEVSAAMDRLEATVIGHLHSPFILATARRLAGIPHIRWAGSSVRRYTGALRQARAWRAFRIVFCPSPTGAEFFKDGGWLTAEFDADRGGPIQWTTHRLPW
jgi:hypothetical protein